jgi:hypothetical protein
MFHAETISRGQHVPLRRPLEMRRCWLVHDFNNPRFEGTELQFDVTVLSGQNAMMRQIADTASRLDADAFLRRKRIVVKER